MSKKYEARINGLIQSHVTTLLETQLNDPRVSGLTVTDVEVSPDTRHAKVFYSILGSPDDKEKAARGLDSAAGWLSRELGRRLRTKNTPVITFVYDESLERGERMGRLLDELKAKENLTLAETMAAAEAVSGEAAAPTVEVTAPETDQAESATASKPKDE